MKYCECGGMLNRHSIKHYKGSSLVGIRYKCKDCSKTQTYRLDQDVIKGIKFFNSTGRPSKNDWRYAAC